MKWTEEELEKCISLLKSGYSYEDISINICKSEGSVRSKLSRLGERSSLYRETHTNMCLNCGEDIHIKNGKRKFCSQSCSASFNNTIRTIVSNKALRICPNCNKEVTKRNNIYCDNNCQILHEKMVIFDKIKNGDVSLSDRIYKKYLIDNYGNQCMECGWDKIHPITGRVPIQLEHIDGNSYNNALDNLKLLCPNCHSLTPTYGALNKGSGRKIRKR